MNIRVNILDWSIIWDINTYQQGHCLIFFRKNRTIETPMFSYFLLLYWVLINLCCAHSHSHVWLFATPWTVACRTPLSVGILQARILEWVVMPSSRESSQPRDWTQVSHIFLHHLSHQGSPWILEWVAYPFFRGSSQPWNRTRVSCIAGGFFISWASREALLLFRKY